MKKYLISYSVSQTTDTTSCEQCFGEYLWTDEKITEEYLSKYCKQREEAIRKTFAKTIIFEVKSYYVFVKPIAVTAIEE